MKRFVAFSMSLVLAVVLVASCAPGDQQAPAITVSGRLLQMTGAAVADTPMLVNGQRVTTDASGRFEATEVTAPYDLVIHVAPQPTVFVLQGLTTDEPVVVLPIGEAARPLRQFQLTLQPVDPVTFGPPPSGFHSLSLAGCGGPVYFDPCGGRGFVETLPSPRTVQWNGDEHVAAHVFALQGYASDAHSQLFDEFMGFAYTGALSFAADSTRTIDLNFRPVETSTITGEVNVPEGFTLTDRTLGFMAGNQSIGVISFEDEYDSVPIEPVFSLATPMVSELDFYLTAVAELGDARVTTTVRGLKADATDVVLNLPMPPQQQAPLAGALGVSEGSVFSWTPMEGAVHFMTVRSSSLNLLVLTVEPKFELPDLSGLGLALGTEEPFRWDVAGYGPVTSMDDLAKGVVFYGMASTVGTSGLRSGTTAP